MNMIGCHGLKIKTRSRHLIARADAGLSLFSDESEVAVDGESWKTILLIILFCWIPGYLMRLVRLTHGVKYLENVIVHRASATGPSTTYLLFHSIGQQTWMRLTHNVGMLGNK